MSRWGDGGPVVSHMKGGGGTYDRLRTVFHIVGSCRPYSKFVDSPMCLI